MDTNECYGCGETMGCGWPQENPEDECPQHGWDCNVEHAECVV